jgi:hypothetical protein
MNRKRQKLIVKSGHSKLQNKLLGSDSRIRGGINDICVLCDKPKKLLLSHIIPRWMYRWCKAEGNGQMVGQYGSIGITTIEQDGTKHYLLCEECEQFLGDAERYVSLLMSEDLEAYRRIGISLNNEEYIGLDANLIQRFILGIAYKAHYASGPPFHNIEISDSTLALIKLTILRDAPDDITFPIIAQRFISDIAPGIDPRAMVISSYMTPKNQCSLFELLATGWSWMVFININDWLPSDLYEMRLRQGEAFKVPIGDITHHRFINKEIGK